jgi:Zn finger protein HypA/HybF involved in hydrogenase expression
MVSVAIEVHAECGTCRMPMPVNTLAPEVRCPGCGRPTAISTDLWKAILRDPTYDGPKMLPNEGRRGSAGKVSFSYTRRGPCCQGCKQEIPATSVQEVKDQAMLRCERCAAQTWVRSVPAALTGALPNVTHLVGEDPDPLANAPASPAEVATFPCPQCGSPVPFDGVTRALTCRFCSASVHVPDDFVYRGKRRVGAPWFLCFHPSIVDNASAAKAVAAGLFDWVEPPLAAVDAEGNLYCAAKQSRWVPTRDGFVREEVDHIVWSVDPSLNVRWIQRGLSRVVTLALSPKGQLLLTDRGGSSNFWFSCSTGMCLNAIDGDLVRGEDLTCDREGFLLILKDQRLRRSSPEGSDVPPWRGSGSKKSKSSMSPRQLPDRPVELNVEASMRIHGGPDGSIYLMDLDELARFDADGQKIYGIKLPSEAADLRYRLLGADLLGNAYILRSKKLVRVSAGGENRVILESKRDGLPRSEMSIAVCPDGSFWLFGKAGLAWKFDPSGALLFASEKEPRPKKATAQEVMQKDTEARMQRAVLEEEEQRRRNDERREAERRRSWEKERPRFIVVTVLMILALLAPILFALWYIFSRPY